MHAKPILLLVAIVAILLAWYTEHNSRSDLTGTWAFPDGVEELTWTSTQYSDVLAIESDGRFSKKQDFGFSWTSYNGTMETDHRGLVRFHVTQIVRGTPFGEPAETATDFIFLCRCDVDSFGYLIVNEYLLGRETQEFDEDMNAVYWRSYRRR